MSLRELTKNSHTAAEKTKFMSAVFKGKMPLNIWADFLYQKSLFYNAIESCSFDLGITKDIPEIKRSFLLMNDAREANPSLAFRYNYVSIDYYQYIMSLYPQPEKITAHLYTWHMGDLHGGQMIKKVINAPHSHLDFDNKEKIIEVVRSKLSDDMATEANVAFNWAIRLMNFYGTEIDF